MKKVKLVFWLLILGAMALVVFQNEGYFLETQQTLRLNLRAFPEYQSPSLPLVAFHLIFFGFGLMVAYLLGILDRWRRRKAVSRLSVETAVQRREIETLKAELARLTGVPPADRPSAPVETSVTSPVAKN